MADEMFRNGFCDDIFRSMKMQMEPSDDVVGSLLAKIAAEAPSPVTENDNVIPFRQPAEIKAEETAAAAVAAVESAPRKHFATTHTGTRKKTDNKSIWYYGTAVAASIIIMISTFALLGTDDDPGNVKNLFEEVVGPHTQIVDQDNPGDETQQPDDGETTSSVQSGKEDDSNHADGEGSNHEDENGSQNSEDNPSGTGTDGTNDGKDGSNGQNPSGGSGEAGKPDENDGNKPQQNPSDKNPSKDSKPDGNGNGKVTPGASGTSDIPWTNEIISTSQVASISVSGGNYVVENTLSRSDVGATLETVTIELPQTSTTNAAEVKAKVREVKNVSSAAMVALDVEGFDQPLVYANANYAPSTLGQFISDLSLEGNMTFSSTVRCQISKVGYSSNHNYKVDINSAAWTYLLSQTSAERAGYNNFTNGNSKALFTSGSNPTGSQIQFGVSDNGYLYIQMLGKKHTFHIGAENAKGFIEYVTGESLE